MKKNFQIREYTSEDQHQFLTLYLLFGEKKKRSRVMHELRQSKSAKRTWQAGIVGIIGIHLSYYFNSTELLGHSAFALTSIPTVFIELLLWTAGVGFAWYKWICREYDAKLLESSKHMALELGNVHKHEKSNAWVLTDGNGILGTVALRYENNEGKIGYLTGEGKEERVELVKHAIRFGQTNKIEVISKLSHEGSKWSEYSL
jgi:hypothetical protein